MRIGIVDVDGHNFPNFALMKIAASTTTHTIMTPDFNTMTPAQQKRLSELMMRNIKNADIMHAPRIPGDAVRNAACRNHNHRHRFIAR